MKLALTAAPADGFYRDQAGFKRVRQLALLASIFISCNVASTGVDRRCPQHDCAAQDRGPPAAIR